MSNQDILDTLSTLAGTVNRLNALEDIMARYNLGTAEELEEALRNRAAEEEDVRQLAAKAERLEKLLSLLENAGIDVDTDDGIERGLGDLAMKEKALELANERLSDIDETLRGIVDELESIDTDQVEPDMR